MLPVLILVPLATTLITFLLYRHVGKREFMRFDIVQFLYAFVFAPIAFIWLKAFLLYIARNELRSPISDTQLFIIDSAFSVIFLYFASFVSIHALTKSFEIKANRDPLYDILEHSEKFHLWISHVSIYYLALTLFMMIALTNIAFPFSIEMSKGGFWLSLVGGYFGGFLGYAVVMLSNFTEKAFMRLMKLAFGTGFSILVLTYFIFEPRFHPTYVMYWVIFMLFSSLLLSSFFIERSQRLTDFINKFHHKHKEGWTQGNYLMIRAQEKEKSSS